MITPFIEKPPLNLSARTVYQYILEFFPKTGHGPTLRQLSWDLHLQEDSLVAALRSLEANGLLRLDPENQSILDAYPYAAFITNHCVVLGSGIRLYGMCAIDVFYIPFLTGSDITIHSKCFLCARDIKVQISGQLISLKEPPTTIIWDSEATYDCPKTNFFCGEAHLVQWKTSAPQEPGKICTLEDAMERGRRAAIRIQQTASSPG